jgi:predicted amidophosphoribosyltransferase
LAPDQSQVAPDPAPPGLPACFAWGSYGGPLRAAIRAWKDGGRRDLEPGLARLLADAVATALRSEPPWRSGAVLVVPVPSSRRAQRLRGDRPLDRIALDALDGNHHGPARLVGPLQPLRHRRRVADQAGLGASSRRANLTSAIEVRPGWEAVVRGRSCLVLDDVITTGSTLAEVARSLRQAGAVDVRAAVIASTPRRPRDA